MLDQTTALPTRIDTQPRIRAGKPRARLEQILIYGLLVLVAALMLVPLLWAIAASFSPNDDVFRYAYPFSWRAFLPVNFTVEAYQSLFSRGFGRSLFNTFILGV